MFALFSWALPTATPAANNLPVAIIGDSIAAAYCLPVKPDQFGFLVAGQEGTIANDYGVNGYSVNSTHVKEVGTPLAPILTPNYYGTVFVIAGTNDMNILWTTSLRNQKWRTLPSLVGDMQSMLTDLRAIEPSADIVVEGVRDLGFNDTSNNYSPAQKAAYAAQIGTYDSTRSRRGFCNSPV
jgi:lysophospholipase L1-like esterase